MKLTEQDLQDACAYIMDEACKTLYGPDYKEKGHHFTFIGTPFTMRMFVDFFIEWLRSRSTTQKTS